MDREEFEDLLRNKNKEIESLKNENEYLKMKSDYLAPNGCPPNIARAIVGLPIVNEYQKMSNPEQNIEHFRILKENKRKIDNLRYANKNLRQNLNVARHRLNVANEFIDSRKEGMIPEHYNDLKYIINECDLESSW